MIYEQTIITEKFYQTGGPGDVFKICKRSKLAQKHFFKFLKAQV